MGVGGNYLMNESQLQRFQLKNQSFFPLPVIFSNHWSPVTGRNRIKLENECQGGMSPEEFDQIVSKLSQWPKSIAI